VEVMDMNFSKLSDLYNLESSTVLFQHVESKELLVLANFIERFWLEIQSKYDQDEHLLEIQNLLKKVLFKFLSSFLPFNQTINKDLNDEMLMKFFQIKRSYPELFGQIISPIAMSYRKVLEEPNNYLHEYLCEYINDRAGVGTRVALITKRSISVEEIMIITNGVKPYVKISFFTENSFRKNIDTFDEVIYIGNPNFYGEYAKNTFKGKNIAFISYDIFNNSMTPKKFFEELDPNGVYSTIYNNVTFGESSIKKGNVNLERAESINIVVNKFIEEQKDEETNSSDSVEASIVYLENERFLFAPIDSKIRIFSPDEKLNFIRQINFKDVDVDNFIVIRNERDTKLIAEVADQDVLKSQAKNYRNLQNEWKEKLRFNVSKKGLKRVSDILINKYHIKTASLASLRSWCNEDSICPVELPKLLKALKFEHSKIEEIYEVMKEIQHAHRKAGRIISEKLMNEINKDIMMELQTKGFYTFESKEFNGASFNIERIVSIDHSRHLIAPYNLMKPINLD
jgi:hypothetical protein